VPTKVRFAAALPRNAAGKLLRRTLREEWAQDG
jgi:acyl-coenzyme A synthetase/AMP-(fatty) acid ligase